MKYTPKRLSKPTPKPTQTLPETYPKHAQTTPKRLRQSAEKPRRFRRKSAQTRCKPAHKWRKRLADVAYYLALAALVLSVFLLRGAGGGPPARVLGFSALRVLTTSMTPELPQGSLVITRQTDPETLEIGDDITYLAGESTTVTHRIVAITEDYMGSGARAFTTQGIANPDPDGAKVPAANVVGKVVFHSLWLGKALSFLRAHWVWLAILLALFIALGHTLRVLFQESRKEKEKRENLREKVTEINQTEGRDEP